MDLEGEVAAFAQRRYLQVKQDRASRLDASLRGIAEAFRDPLFSALREGYMASDPTFRARMESLSREE